MPNLETLRHSLFPKKIWSFCFSFFLVLAVLAFLYTLHDSAFPISTLPIYDDAEHLHVAYLLGQGERPFIDFMENHPLLFNHFLWWLHESSGVTSVKAWNMLARVFMLGHFILCLFVLSLWASQLVTLRLQGRHWLKVVLLALCMTGFLHEFFFWIWQLRPDFFSHAYTLAGSYLVYLFFQYRRPGSWFWLIAGGAFIGAGNAILPKGIFLLLPMLLVLFSSWLLKLRNFREDCLNRTNIVAAAIVGVTVIVSFLSGMLLDCRLSDITPRQWISGVLLLNGKKHLIYTLNDMNPVTSVVHAFDLPFPLLVLLLLYGVWQCGRLNELTKTKQYGNIYIALFIFFVITINLLFPSFANGITWAYNFTPSLFAVFLIYLLILNKIGILLNWNDTYLPLKHQAIVYSTLTCLFFSQVLLPKTAEAFFCFQQRIAEQKFINVLALTDYLPESRMPKNLTYLSPFPMQAPIQAKRWGYHWFLVLDHGFWQDCYRLGLGPDPANYIEEFQKNPPDALAFDNDQQLQDYIVALKKCQGIEGSLILKEIHTHYTKMATQGLMLYIRNQHIPNLLNAGWRRLEN